MRLVVGFAGVPPQIFDGFRRGQDKLVEAGDQIITQSFKGGDLGYYANPHANFFLSGFSKLLADDNHNELNEVGFAVAYVTSHAGAEAFAERLFPSVFTVPVDWVLTGHNRTTWGRSLSELNSLLRRAVILARQALPPLRKELVEQASRTPWLLPVKNFRSRTLVKDLQAVHERLRTDEDKMVVLRKARSSFERFHPPQRTDTRNRPCFVDDLGIEFHPPGAARHAYARENFSGHPAACLVAGRRRLGSPYDRAFHYDCARGDSVLRARLSGCHSSPTLTVGDPHINVAPNDFCRV
jgi:hypothetical protein